MAAEQKEETEKRIFEPIFMGYNESAKTELICEIEDTYKEVLAIKEKLDEKGIKVTKDIISDCLSMVREEVPKKLGFIGCGNMGKAMIHGVLASGKCGVKDILASAKTESSREKNAAELGIKLTADNKSVAEFADILFLAVKPQYY